MHEFDSSRVDLALQWQVLKVMKTLAGGDVAVLLELSMEPTMVEKDAGAIGVHIFSVDS